MKQDELVRALKKYGKHLSDCQLNMSITENPCDECNHCSSGCIDNYSLCSSPELRRRGDCYTMCNSRIPDCVENCDEVQAYIDSKGKIVCTCGLSDAIKGAETAQITPLQITA